HRASPPLDLRVLARETWGGTPRYGTPDAPFVDCSLGSAQLAVTRGPLSKCLRMQLTPKFAARARKTVIAVRIQSPTPLSAAATPVALPPRRPACLPPCSR